MKKGITYLLFILLFLAAPSISHAQGLFKPGDSFRFLNNITSHQETTTSQSQSIIANLGQTSSENSSILPSLSINLLGTTISVLDNQSPSLLKVDLNGLVEFDKEADGQTEDSGNLLGINLGLPVAGNVNLDLLQGNLGSGEETSLNGKVAGLEVSDSVLLGDTKINILPEMKDVDGSTSGGIVTVDSDNSLLGENHVGLMKVSKKVNGDTNDIHSGLLLTDFEDSLIGDAHLGIAEVSKSESPSSEETHSDLITLGLDNPALGESHIGVVETNQTETPEGKTVSGSLVVADTKDAPVIGDVHVGVGEASKTETPTSEETHVGIVNVGVSNEVTGDTNIGLGNYSKTETDEGKTVSGSVAVIDTKDTPVVGDVHVGVGEASKTETPTTEETHVGVVNVGVDNPAVGDTNIEIGDYTKTETDEGTSVSGGVVVVDTEDSPVGDIHVGVGETGNDQPSDPSVSDDNSNPENPSTPETEVKPENPSNEEGNEQSSTPVVSDNNNGSENPSTPVISDNNTGSESPSTPVVEVKPENPANVEVPSVPAADDEQSTPVQTNQESASEKDIDLENNQTDTESLTATPVTSNGGLTLASKKAAAEDMEAENNIVIQDNHAQIELEKAVNSAGNGLPESSAQVTTPTGLSTSSNSGSGTGAGGASVSSGSSGIAAYLALDYQNELALKDKVQFILKELSDEWIKAPPIAPPKSFFFLQV